MVLPMTNNLMNSALSFMASLVTGLRGEVQERKRDF